MNRYAFREKYAEGEQAVKLVELHICEEWPGTLVKRPTIEQDRRGIDLWVKYPDGAIATLQVKRDSKMARFQNFFLETVSVVPDTPGWIYTCQSDFFLYVNWVSYDVYWFHTVELQRAFAERWKGRPEKRVQNEGWETMGVPVPIPEVVKCLKPMKTNLTERPGHDLFDEEPDCADEPDPAAGGSDDYIYIVGPTGQLAF